MTYNNRLPIYQQIIDSILLSVARGELRPGEKVAPVREMAADFKVNPNTMQRSLAKLEDMGYMYSERTSGRFVTQDLGMVARLKAQIPEQITGRYVEEMLVFGMDKAEIGEYVRSYIERVNGNG